MLTTLIATMILATPAADGFVVCADREAFIPSAHSFDESHRKLFPAGPNGIIVVAGAATFTNPDGRKIFDAQERLGELFAGLKLPQDTDGEIKRRAVRWLLDGYFQSGASRAPRTGYFGAERATVFVGLIFYLEAGHPHVVSVEIEQASRDQMPKGKSFGFTPANATAAGITNVFTEVQSGKDRRFDDLRKDPRVRDFIIRDVSPLVASSRVVDFSKWFFKEVSQRMAWMTDDPTAFVGSVADCGTITATGVRWHLYDGPPPQPSRRIK